MSSHGILPRLLTVCLIAFRSLHQPGHPLELGASRHSPFDLRYRLSSPLAAVLTASATSSQLDNKNAIDIDSSTSSTLIHAIIICHPSSERSRSRTHLTRFSPQPNVSAQTITFCGPVQLVLETGGPDMSGMFSVKWLTRSPLLLLAKLVQCVSRIADFTR
jgi:hypothetical protein